MSKKIARCSLYVLGMACLTVQAAEPLTSLDKPEGRLDIIAWPGYIERGQTDKQYDWVSQFEKDTGCQVNVKTAATSDEMVSLMAKGGYDLVTASGDASLRLIMGKRVQPINTALIAGWGSLDPRIAKGTWFNVGGKVYGTPWCSSSRIYRMVKPTRGGCRPMMARSISPTPRCLSKPPSRSWGSKTPIN